jgi:hypothetical protein
LEDLGRRIESSKPAWTPLQDLVSKQKQKEKPDFYFRLYFVDSLVSKNYHVTKYKSVQPKRKLRKERMNLTFTSLLFLSPNFSAY